MRVVIDTNCLIASIPSHSEHFWLYRAFMEGVFEWVVSNEILAEYEEQLALFYSERTAELVLNILSVAPNVIFAEPYFKWQLIEKDADDNKFADLAISLGAEYLVSNDKHFNILKKISFPKVNVVTIQKFRTLLGWDSL